MSTTTDYMGLVLYDPYNEDANTEGRVYVNTTSGVGTGSNMYKVNEYMKGKATVIIKTAAQWAADTTTILRTNDLGLASDTNIMKRGDGTSTWEDLDAVDQTYANFVAAGYTGTQTEFYALLSSISSLGNLAFKSTIETDDITNENITADKIASNAVTNAKSAKMAAYTLKGNNTNAAAVPQDITASNVRSMIDAQETMQYTAMPETVTNGTIIQYIGETTIVAPIYTNGHFYKGIDGAWKEIVYGDPNSVSYDAQDKTDAQKAQARTNIGAADVAAFSAHYTNGVVDGLGLGTPATGSGNVDVAEGLDNSLREALGAQAVLPITSGIGTLNTALTNDMSTIIQSYCRYAKWGRICQANFDFPFGTTAKTVNSPVTLWSGLPIPQEFLMFKCLGNVENATLHITNGVLQMWIGTIPANLRVYGTITYITAN